MKRTAAAVLAATTALSLAAVPAHAADDVVYLRGLNKPGGSSAVSDKELGEYFFGAGFVEGANEKGLTNNEGLTSSVRSMYQRDQENKTHKFTDAANGPLKSSFKNDANNGYKVGTTFEILLGTGIAALVLAVLGGAAYAGVIPGVQLPF